MAIHLLQLGNGHCSLELSEDDLDRLAAAISEAYGQVGVETEPTLTTYRFGGETFTFQNEWGEPCLISGSVLGDEMLEDLAKRLG